MGGVQRCFLPGLVSAFSFDAKPVDTAIKQLANNGAALLLRQRPRALVSNGETAPVFGERVCTPLRRAAALAPLINGQMYRGMLFHYFRRGCRYGHRTNDRVGGPMPPGKTSTGWWRPRMRSAPPGRQPSRRQNGVHRGG